MSQQTLHVACGQILCQAGDIDHNLEQVERMSLMAGQLGARLILFPEAAVTGYLLMPDVLGKALSSFGPEAERLVKIARERDIVIAAGTIERGEDALHVSHFIVFPDGNIIIQRKHSLTPKEKNAEIVPGPEDRTLFEVDGVKCALLICADTGIKDINNKLVRQGVQLVLAPTAGGAGREFMHHEGDLDDPELRRKYLESMEKVCFVGKGLENCWKRRTALMATNLSGDDGHSNYHPGHSMIIDGRGMLHSLIPGEYIVEYLRPQMIHNEILVQEPRVWED